MKYVNDISLSCLLSDKMVLQRGKETKIWGGSKNSEVLKIDFLEQTYETVANEQGKWEVILYNLEAGGPYDMTIKSNDNSIVIKDILIGDVYVCSGQSNMELPINRVMDLYEDEVNEYSNSNIRRFTILKEYDFNGPQTEVNGSGWLEINPQNAYDCSAVAYFFAKDLYEKYKVPIGRIINAVGGSPVEAWMSENALKNIQYLVK